MISNTGLVYKRYKIGPGTDSLGTPKLALISDSLYSGLEKSQTSHRILNLQIHSNSPREESWWLRMTLIFSL